MSLPEVLLWRALRRGSDGPRFRRQHPQGIYIADFVCLTARVAIEIDGEAHNRANRPERDMRKEAFLRAAGFDVVHIPAADVLRDTGAVADAIVRYCRARDPLHHPAAPDGPPPRAGEDLA